MPCEITLALGRDADGVHDVRSGIACGNQIRKIWASEHGPMLIDPDESPFVELIAAKSAIEHRYVGKITLLQVATSASPLDMGTDKKISGHFTLTEEANSPTPASKQESTNRRLLTSDNLTCSSLQDPLEGFHLSKFLKHQIDEPVIPAEERVDPRCLFTLQSRELAQLRIRDSRNVLTSIIRPRLDRTRARIMGRIEFIDDLDTEHVAIVAPIVPWRRIRDRGRLCITRDDTLRQPTPARPPDVEAITSTHCSRIIRARPEHSELGARCPIRRVTSAETTNPAVRWNR